MSERNMSVLLENCCIRRLIGLGPDRTTNGALEDKFVSGVTQPESINATSQQKLCFHFTLFANTIGPLDLFDAHRLSCFAKGAF